MRDYDKEPGTNDNNVFDMCYLCQMAHMKVTPMAAMLPTMQAAIVALNNATAELKEMRELLAVNLHWSDELPF